jgi:hypothetical protein
MKTSRIISRVSISVVAALTFAALPALPAMAAENTAAAPSSTKAVMTSTNGTAALAPDASGNACANIWVGFTSSLAGNVLWTFRQTTNYCWNGSIVTSHSTGYSWSVTSWGSVSGYRFQGLAYNKQVCYVASGRTNNCSGNYQSLAATFGSNTGTIGGGTGQCVQAQQWELYNGASTQKIFMNNFPNYQNVPCIIH